MPISVTSLGSTTDSGAATTMAIAGLTVPSGALIFVSAFLGGPSTFPTVTVADTAGNSYIQIASARLGSSSNWLVAFYVSSATALSTGTITLTSSATFADGNVNGLYATGITGAVIDSAVTATISVTSSTNPAYTLTSGTPAVAGELFIELIAINNNNVALDTSNGWAAPPDHCSSPAGHLLGGNQVNAGTGTKQSQPIDTLPTVNFQWAGMILGFKPGATLIAGSGRVALQLKSKPYMPSLTAMSSRVSLQLKTRSSFVRGIVTPARVTLQIKNKPPGTALVPSSARATIQLKAKPLLQQDGPRPVRVSQDSPITVSQDKPSARVSQDAALSIVYDKPSARVSQDAALSVATAVPSARVSQDAALSVAKAVSSARVSQQAVIFVFKKYYQPPPPLVYPELPGLTYALTRTPVFANATASGSSGREVRLDYATIPTWKFELTYSVLRDRPGDGSTEFEQMLGFFFANVGSTTTFLYRNPIDCHVERQVQYTTLGPNFSLYGPIYRAIGYEGFTSTEPVGYVNQEAGFKLYLDDEVVDPDRYTLIRDAVGNQLIKFYDTPAAGKTIKVDMAYYYACNFDPQPLQFEEFMAHFHRLQRVTLLAPRPRISLTANLGIAPNEGGGFGFVAN